MTPEHYFGISRMRCDALCRRQTSQADRTVTPNAANVCAVVVAYYPDDGFEARLEQIRGQVAMLVIVDNTPEETVRPCLNESLQEMPQVHFIENRVNRGIATALNQGLEIASKEGFQWILTLDQDTQCYPDMVDTLLKVSVACEPKPMVVGSNYLDPQNNRTKVSAGGGEEFLEQKTVITSGSLVDVCLAAAIGGFRENYFIDQVDYEFCLRARAHGHMVVISRKVVMTHSVGRSGGVRLPFLGVLPNHPPLRKYYIARNAVVTIANYWRHEPAWCLLRLVRLLLGFAEMAILEQHRLSKVRAFASGVADGLRGRMGICLRWS